MALPGRTVVLFGTLAWAAVIAAGAAFGLMAEGWQADERIRAVAVIYGIGGAIGFPVGLFAANLISARGRPERRFASMFLCLMLATVGATVAIYVLQYRLYYAQWHAETLSVTWVFQFVFTSLGAVFQFAVSGLRLYFPTGFVALLAVSAMFAFGKR